MTGSRLSERNWRLLQLLPNPAAQPPPGPAGPVQGAAAREDPAIRAGKEAKLHVLEKQITVKCNKLQARVEAVPQPDSMKESDFREHAIDAKEWKIKLEEIQKLADVLEQDGATLSMDVKGSIEECEQLYDSVHIHSLRRG